MNNLIGKISVTCVTFVLGIGIGLTIGYDNGATDTTETFNKIAEKSRQEEIDRRSTKDVDLRIEEDSEHGWKTIVVELNNGYEVDDYELNDFLGKYTVWIDLTNNEVKNEIQDKLDAYNEELGDWAEYVDQINQEFRKAKEALKNE